MVTGRKEFAPAAKAIRQELDSIGDFVGGEREEVIKGEYQGPRAVYIIDGKRIEVPVLTNSSSPSGVERNIVLPRSVSEWKVGDSITLSYDVTPEKARKILWLMGGNILNQDHTDIARRFLATASPQSAFFYASGNDVRTEENGQVCPETTALFIIHNIKESESARNGGIEIQETVTNIGKTAITFAHIATQGLDGDQRVIEKGESVLSFLEYPYVPKPAVQGDGKNKPAKVEPDYSAYEDCGGEPITMTTEKVRVFAGEISGDLNPVHRDKKYAKRTIFGDPISHGLPPGAIAVMRAIDYLREKGVKDGRFRGCNINFKGPTLIDKTRLSVKVSIEAQKAEEGNVHNFAVFNERGRVVMAGSLTLA